MQYTVDLKSKSVVPDVKISDHYYGTVISVSFEVTAKDYVYASSVTMPKKKYTKGGLKKKILSQFRKHLVEENVKLVEEDDFKEQYKIEV